jgi:phosphoribosylanthranilate isomerase
MADPFLIKICGLSTPATLSAALEAGADMVGFVFFPPSPRNITMETARQLSEMAAEKAQTVALVVDADDGFLGQVVEALRPKILQLHGKESPQRVAEIRARFGLPVMKALGVSSAEDFEAVGAYEEVCDRLLFDAKPPKDATRPGGNGLAFDWSLLRGRQFRKPWMLSGGLTIDSVSDAILAPDAPGIDVSSGVESAPGVKDPHLITTFMARARNAASQRAEPLGSQPKSA